MLRYGIGTDYFSYINAYTSNFTNKAIEEPGFQIIGMICLTIGFSPFAFIAVIAGITYGLICFAISRKHIFSVTIFYILSFSYLHSYNIVRQMLAVSMLLCGLHDHYYGKKGRCVFYFIFSFFIHYSSIIAITMIIFSNIKIGKWARIIISIIIIFILCFTDLYYFFIFAASFISPKLALYANLLDSANWNSGITLLIFAIPSILILFNTNKIEKIYKGNMVLNLNILYIAMIIFIYKVPAFARIHTTTLFIPLFLLYFLFNLNDKYSKLYYYFLISVFFLVFIRGIGINLVGTPSAGISPYTSILTQ
jgi:hypothetical protein